MKAQGSSNIASDRCAKKSRRKSAISSKIHGLKASTEWRVMTIC